MSFACLPWYDLAEIRDATDALWRGLVAGLHARGIGGVPGALERRVHYEDQWSSGGLLLGQACGYDVLMAHAHHLRLVATPCYAADGCEGPTYRSLVVVRDGHPARSLAELRGARCVINTPTSHSGMNVLRSLVAPLSENGRFFASAVVSGAHETSLELLRGGHADVAAIDCVTYALLIRHRPEALAGTRIVHRTAAVAAPPYVTSATTPDHVVEALRAELAAATSRPADAAIMERLGLRGVEVLEIEAYEPIAELERMADGFGYTELSLL